MTPDREASAFAPATVGNVICGFDIFGLALDSPGDRVTLRLRDEPGLVFSRIEGDEGRLPTEPERNVASLAIQALLRATGRRDGIEIDLEKGLPLSGGMGGSAASSAAAVVAADALLGTEAPPEVLLECALAGEAMVSGGAHLDNVAPALFGGLLLVRPSPVRPVIRLPVPGELSVALLHPSVEMSTREGRAALGNSVPLADAVTQWGHTAAFVHALHTEDWELMSDALEDRIAEPHRASRIPAFAEVRRAAREAGAIGCGISGSGPSIFALCRSPESAGRVGKAMHTTFTERADHPVTLHHSRVAARGARVLPNPPEPRR